MLRRRVCASLVALVALTACSSSSAPSARATSAGGGGGGGVTGVAGGGAAGEGGAGGGTGGHAGAAGKDPAAVEYPTMSALFAQTVTQSCALNSGECHNAKYQPDLTSYGGFLAGFGAACQQQDSPLGIFDVCEREGDHLVFADGVDRIILSVDVPADAGAIPTHVTATLDGPAGDTSSLRRVRKKLDGSGNEIDEDLAGVVAKADDPATTLDVDLTMAAPDDAKKWDLRVYPRPEGSIIVGDPNGNGVAGASLGWREIVAGDPSKSFFYQKLLGDQYGLAMPPVTSPWSATATRAIYCFIRSRPAGSVPDASTADETIDYASCPPDPNAPNPSTTGYPAVTQIMKASCAIVACHKPPTNQSGLDLTPPAFPGILGRASTEVPSEVIVAPGEPMASYLLCKVDPDCTTRMPGSLLMPKDLPMLTPDEIATIRDWIASGAPLE